MQERRVREKNNAQDFYISSLKPELHPVYQGNLTLHYFKRFTKFLHPYTSKICKNTRKRLLNYTRIKSAQQDTSCRPGKPLSTTTKHKKY